MTKILGIGNALVDIIIKLDSDKILDDFSLPKGSMQLIDKEKIKFMLEHTADYKKHKSSGGSAANTIHGLSKLGVKTGYIGKIGDDELGTFFTNDMCKLNIEPVVYKSQTATGTCMSFVSPDSERTLCTYLGAAIELNAEDLVESAFNGYDYFHIEGYLVQNHELIERALYLAKKNNLYVSLDLASYNVVEENLEFLKSLTKKYVDIIFANEEEAKAFTGEEQAEKALDIISEYCDIAVVKIGRFGSLIKKDNKTYKIGVVDSQCIDTTGAGDLYASGFLYGLTKNYDLEKSGKIGAITAGNVIEIIGTKMSDDKWTAIKNQIEQI